jgi:pimeloyl-ACP methyl ester carboxylesterase
VRRGSGDPLVLVHGLGSHLHCWDPILDELAAAYDVVAVDLPGFGHTPLPPGFRPSPQSYAAWLAAWLREIGIERPHVVGNSMGGGIALEMARDGTASRVTAFSPIGFWERAGVVWCQRLLTALRTVARAGGDPLGRAMDVTAVRAAAVCAAFGHPTRVPPDAARADLAALAGCPAFEAARDSFSGYTFTDAAGLDGVPVTVAWGTRDVVLTHRTQSRRARALLPAAQHVDLVGCGHVPFLDDPGLCVRTIVGGVTGGTA